MAENKQKVIVDGATLSPKLEPATDAEQSTFALPIGRTRAAGGAAIARAYKHAAGKSESYGPQAVDMIYHMSREGRFEDDPLTEFVAAKLAAERDTPRAADPVTWDQLVLLPANLTRLVIDPYREHCHAQVRIGRDRPEPLVLDWPIVFDGVDFARLPVPLCRCISDAAAKAALAAE